MNSTIQSIGEHALIERLRRRAGAPPAFVTIGIGDDAAAIESEGGHVQVVTTDSLVEGVHFRRDWTRLDAVGHKALAVNLSDLAAMGASPRGVLLSLVLPADLALSDFDALIEGFLACAERDRAPLVGGNFARSPGPIVIDVTAIGSAHRRRVLTRSGARAGDELYVTGTLGGAAAGLARLQAGIDRGAMDEVALACVRRYERPDPRLAIGVRVGRTRAATAAIDLSDGLGDAARQLSDASGAGVVIDADSIPVDPGTAAWCESQKCDPIAFVLGGGEDYELLFAVGRRQRRAFLAAASSSGSTPVTLIGRVSNEPGAWLNRSGRLEPIAGGFTHF
jgi:thiamine-monophosphate kinase